MTVSLTVSTNVIERAEFQCELIRLDAGRCSGTSCDKHHVRFKSHGGDDTEDNLVLICRNHHTQIHDGKLTGPYWDERGRFFAQEVGPRDRIVKARWHVWHELREELEARFFESYSILANGAQWGQKSKWSSAWAFEQMSRMALWLLDPDLNPEDTTFGEYLRNRGLIIADNTLTQYINVAVSLRDRGVTLEDVLGAVDECSQVHQFPAGYSAIRDNLPTIRKMDREQIVNLLSTTPSSDFKATIHDRLEDGKNKAAAQRGETRVTMSATLTVEIEHTMTSVGTEFEDRGKLEGRIRQALGKRMVPGSDRFKHHLRDVLRTEAE